LRHFWLWRQSVPDLGPRWALVASARPAANRRPPRFTGLVTGHAPDLLEAAADATLDLRLARLKIVAVVAALGLLLLAPRATTRRVARIALALLGGVQAGARFGRRGKLVPTTIRKQRRIRLPRRASATRSEQERQRCRKSHRRDISPPAYSARDRAASHPEKIRHNRMDVRPPENLGGI
jgi:hypothetical protein